MATLTVVSDLTKTPLTRQDIFDAWTSAALGTISAGDLASDLLSVTVASSFSDVPSSPTPGALAWVADEQTMFCYHDEIDGTGVSLWLAVGPDVFETACLLHEPAFPGALVEPVLDRWVAPAGYTDSPLGDGVRGRSIGNVHSGVPYPLNSRSPDTLASGTWVRVGIDGFCFGHIANGSGASDGFFTPVDGRGVAPAPVTAAHPDLPKGSMISVTAINGRMGARNADGVSTEPYHGGFCGIQIYSPFSGNAAGDVNTWGMHVRYRFTGYQDQQDRSP